MKRFVVLLGLCCFNMSALAVLPPIAVTIKTSLPTTIGPNQWGETEYEFKNNLSLTVSLSLSPSVVWEKAVMNLYP